MDKLLRALERRFARYALPNVAAFLVAPKVVFFFWAFLEAGRTGGGSAAAVFDQLILVPELVFRGEVWRIFTFVLLPPPMNPLFFIFYVLLLFMYCAGLQARWGPLRLWIFVLFGWLAMVAASFVAHFLQPGFALSYGLITVESTIFLAFATYYPNVELRVYFVIPVKVKWLALLLVGFGAMLFLQGPWDRPEGYAHRVVILGAGANYLLFFGPALWTRFRELRGAARRRNAFESAMRRGWEERDRLAEEDREREREREER